MAIDKVAIIGAGGNSGRYMTEALVKSGKTVTAVTRQGSQTTLPEGVLVKRYTEETLVDALQGQEVLIITLSGFAVGAEEQIIKAATEAKVQWIFPNEWSPDTANEDILRDVSVFQHKAKTRKQLEELGLSYIAVSTGFWYEWSLAIPAAFGIDFAKRTALFFDDGETKISISTWPQVGRAVAAILNLPNLDTYRNKIVYVNSFTISQKEMLESAKRITGDNDWTITRVPSHERYAEGIKEIKEGQRVGFAKMMYTRIFYPDGSGLPKETLNAVLDLPTEDLDEATERAYERSKTWRMG